MQFVFTCCQVYWINNFWINKNKKCYWYIDLSIGHAHILVYGILVVSKSGLVWQTNGENGGKSNVNIEYFKIYEK